MRKPIEGRESRRGAHAPAGAGRSVRDPRRPPHRGTRGRSLLAPFELPSRDRIALVADRQGAVFGVLRSTGGDRADRKAEVGEWIWHEVWTDDVTGAGRLYAELAGYIPKEREILGTTYHDWSQGDRPRVGLVRKPDPELGNTWVTYLRVADVQTAADRAASPGGTPLMEPRRRAKGHRRRPRRRRAS